ncbi:MAG: DMT family transporter [Candidatus Latescibacterota bacterium]
MTKQTYKADALLLLAAFIWGTTFVAQRTGMDYVEPFIFNAARFFLGTLILLPIARKYPLQNPLRQTCQAGIILGAILFFGAALQQIGLVYTTAGKAGFITGLYVIIVPFMGLFLSMRIGRNAWVGALLATVGLYFLSIRGDFTFSYGDLLVFIGAFFWALHILFVGRVAPHHNVFHLATLQFGICACLSFTMALFTETISLAHLQGATTSIVYSGIFSAAIAFTLQIYAQKHTPETHAAIIFSLEAVFAALAGWAVLHETLTAREGFGCGLMLAGMLIAQFDTKKPEQLAQA